MDVVITVEKVRAPNAGSRSLYILVPPEPETQRDAAGAPTAQAQNLMFNVGRLSKISQAITVFY
jgi:hypothetical protein